MLTDTSGTSVETFRYDAWGKMEPEPMWDLTYTYIGRARDIDSGLMYLMARYYKPETGRFLNEEPGKYGTELLLYIYGRNNPILNIDKLGLFTIGSDVPEKYHDILKKAGKEAYNRAMNMRKCEEAYKNYTGLSLTSQLNIMEIHWEPSSKEEWIRKATDPNTGTALASTSGNEVYFNPNRLEQALKYGEGYALNTILHEAMHVGGVPGALTGCPAEAIDEPCGTTQWRKYFK